MCSILFLLSIHFAVPSASFTFPLPPIICFLIVPHYLFAPNAPCFRSLFISPSRTREMRRLESPTSASVARASTSFKLHTPLVPMSASRNCGTMQPHLPERAAIVHATNPNGYYTQSPYYSHVVSWAQTPDTYYSHFQYANSLGASLYSNPSALQAYL